MREIIQKLITAITGNSLLHGFFMAAMAAIAVILLPVVQDLSNGVPVIFPSIAYILKAALGAGLLYILKNFFMGSSVKKDANVG